MKVRAIYQMENRNRLKSYSNNFDLLRKSPTAQKTNAGLKAKVATTSRLCFTWVTKDEQKAIGVVRLSQRHCSWLYFKGQEWLKQNAEMQSFQLITNYAAYKDERQELGFVADYWNPSKQISATVFKPIK